MIVAIGGAPYQGARTAVQRPLSDRADTGPPNRVMAVRAADAECEDEGTDGLTQSGEIGQPASSFSVICRHSFHGLHRPQAEKLRECSRGGESPLIEFLNRLFHEDEKGQTMAEYAVVLGVITIAVVVALGALSTKITSVLGNVITQM
jgi:Flp pilus assembly pilin Flp